jgi:hypothetical protein
LAARIEQAWKAEIPAANAVGSNQASGVRATNPDKSDTADAIDPMLT